MDEMQKTERKRIRNRANYAAGGLIVYDIITIGMVFLYMLVATIMVMGFVPGAAEDDAIFDAYITPLMESDVISIVAVTVGTLILALFFSGHVTKEQMLHSEKKMTVKVFFQLLCIFMMGQLVFSFGGELLEKFLNLFGYSALESIESASQVSQTWSLFIYSSFVGPIVEEIIYRGFVLRSFEKYGKVLAIVVSAILFGAMHGNLPQGLFAAGVGLVLGYTAIEYSIGWAILLHIVNNCVFSDLIGMAISGWSENTQELFYNSMFGMFGVFAVIILWKNRKEVKEFLQENRMSGRIFRYIMTTIGMIVFLIICAVQAFMGLTPLE